MLAPCQVCQLAGLERRGSSPGGQKSAYSSNMQHEAACIAACHRAAGQRSITPRLLRWASSLRRTYCRCFLSPFWRIRRRVGCSVSVAVCASPAVSSFQQSGSAPSRVGTPHVGARARVGLPPLGTCIAARSCCCCRCLRCCLRHRHMGTEAQGPRLRDRRRPVVPFQMSIVRIVVARLGMRSSRLETVRRGRAV
jgi:hypothetical protein